MNRYHVVTILALIGVGCSSPKNKTAAPPTPEKTIADLPGDPLKNLHTSVYDEATKDLDESKANEIYSELKRGILSNSIDETED